jgi:exopolyphosphatase / guanosine-5'-triphosphate,3'-diphosphate pyrophosphatase
MNSAQRSELLYPCGEADNVSGNAMVMWWGEFPAVSVPSRFISHERFNLNATPKPGTARGGAGGKDKRRHAYAGRADVARDSTVGVVLGALDLGTNNCRLLLASPHQRGFRVVDAFSRIVRLGEGLGLHGKLNDAAMDRTIEALRVCANKLKWHRVTKHRLVATEACRLASNGAEFIARVERETGLVLEIIDRETEAHLAAAGAEPLLQEGAQSAVVFDIGGGSTEVMWMERSDAGAQVAAWVSMAAGVVTLSERHNGGRDVTDEKYAAMRADVGLLLAPFLDDVRSKRGISAMPDHLLGTSGTVTTIAGVHLGLRHYDRSRVDGSWLEGHEIDNVTADLRRMTYEERTRNGCIGRERADLVLAGCAILEEIRAAFPDQRIRVADRGLREGILAQLMKAGENT